MAFDENVSMMEDYMEPNHIPRTIFKELIDNDDKSSKPVLERDPSFTDNNTKEQFQGSQGQTISENGDSLQMMSQAAKEKTSLQGRLEERVAARAGFNAPRLNIENIRSADFLFNPDVPSSCLTISSPGLSPTTLLESPIFLLNPLDQPSPTTGKFSFLPGGNGDMPSYSFEEVNGSFACPAVSNCTSSFFPCATSRVDAAHQTFPGFGASVKSENSLRNQAIESVESISQDKGSANVVAEFHGSSKERNISTNSDAASRSAELCLPADPQEEEQGVEGGGTPGEDGYNWRKYGQKHVKGGEFPRSYYRCTYPNCSVTKKVQQSSEGHIREIIYEGAHNHSKQGRRSAVGSSNPSADNNSQEKGLQIQSGTQFESGEAVDGSLAFSNDEDQGGHGVQGSVSPDYDGEGDESESKKRKLELEVYASEMSGATRAIREPRVVVQTTSKVDVLDDGYRWRKYGQKVVKGNPNPRSYYKCTAPGCNVRKHVERASHDRESVITTYEGKHIHDVPAARNCGHGSSSGSAATQQATAPAAQTYTYQPNPRYRLDTPGSVSSSASNSFNPFSLHQQQLVGPLPQGLLSLGNIGFPTLGFRHGDLPVLPGLPRYFASQPAGSGLWDLQLDPLPYSSIGLSNNGSS